MPTLFDPAVRTALTVRVQAFHPDCRGQWGRMTPHQAVCHLCDGFRMALGERQVSRRATVLSPLVRWAALWSPLPWPKGVRTVPEADQEAGGTQPVEFACDRDELLTLIDRFCAKPPAGPWPDHPMFGRMDARHWGRWAYLHLDHHLKQFGL